MVMPERNDMVEAFARIRSVAHDISQTVDLVHLLVSNMRKHRLKCFEIAMDVTDDRAFHGQNDFSGANVSSINDPCAANVQPEQSIDPRPGRE